MASLDELKARLRQAVAETPNPMSGAQNLIGGLYGLAATRRLPRYEGGAMVFESDDPSQMPTAFGNTIVAPRGTRPEFLKHERRHVGQSNVLGGAYLPTMVASGNLANTLGRGDLDNPLERDAYRHQLGLEADSPARPGGAGTGAGNIVERYLRALLGD